MKKQFSFLFATLFILFAGVTSCNKDSDQKTKEEMLTQGSWKFKSATANGSPYTSFASCQTDNIITFNSSGSGVVNEGATKCNGADPATIPFTWSFISNQTEIQLSVPLFDNAGTKLTLVSLTDSRLVVTIGIVPPGPGPVILAEVTFEH